MHPFRAFRDGGRCFAALCSLVLAFGGLSANAAATTISGEIRTAVILVNFNDKMTQPITATSAHDLVFGTVSDYFWEASYQKTFLAGDTFGWFTIPVSSSNCNRSIIAEEGKRSAIAAGANLAQYTHIIYMFPTNTGCSWSGVAGTAASGEKQVFINNSFSTYVVAHELGHTFGLLHSDALDCDTHALGAICQQRSAGDGADGMGSRSAHFNAFQKEQIGWLGATGTPAITTVGSSGRYVIEPMSVEGKGASKALKILKDTDPVTGQKTWYYVEYRQPVGFDGGLAAVGNLSKGVIVRTGTLGAANYPTSLLLDMTPGSDNTSSISDLRDAALLVGQRYEDTVANVAITLVSADTTGAVVDVSIDAGTPVPTCARVAPVLTLASPVESIGAGGTLTYILSLTNRDSSACSATTFSVAKSAPTGWAATLASTNLSVSPGATASTTLSVTSPMNAVAGSYSVGAGVSSAAVNVHTGSASAIYTVTTSATGTLTQSVGTDKASYLRGESVHMSALVKRGGVPVPNVTVKFSVTRPDGTSALMSATSGNDGFARAVHKLGKGKTAIGNYVLRADSSVGGDVASASSGFSVK